MHPFHFLPLIEIMQHRKKDILYQDMVICYQGVAADVFILLFPSEDLEIVSTSLHNENNNTTNTGQNNWMF